MSELKESIKLILIIALAILSGLFGFVIGYIFRTMAEIENRTKHILESLKSLKKGKDKR